MNIALGDIADVHLDIGQGSALDAVLECKAGSEFGLGGGSLSCPQAQNVAMGGLHITLPMRSDAQDRIINYLHQDEVADTELTHAAALSIESAPLPPIADDPSLQKSSVTFGPDRDCISIPQGDAICMRKLP